MKRHAYTKKSLFGPKIVFEYEFTAKSVDLYFSKIRGKTILKSNVYSFSNDMLPYVVRAAQVALDLGMPIRLLHKDVIVVVRDLWENELPRWTAAPLLSKLIPRLCELQQENLCGQAIIEDAAERKVGELELRLAKSTKELEQLRTQVANQAHSLSEMQEVIDSHKAYRKKLSDIRYALRNLASEAKAVEQEWSKLCGAKIEKPYAPVPPDVLKSATDQLAQQLSIDKIYTPSDGLETDGLYVICHWTSKAVELKEKRVMYHQGYAIPVHVKII